MGQHSVVASSKAKRFKKNIILLFLGDRYR